MNFNADQPVNSRYDTGFRFPSRMSAASLNYFFRPTNIN